jgi:hypothetical protein
MGRLNYIEIEVNDGTITLPWDSRDLLLHEIASTEGAAEIRKAFDDAGASRPVELTDEQKSDLLHVLNRWCQRVTAEGLPEGIDELRCELTDDAVTADR